ncbi:MAG: hypothetical protein IPK82_43530 [Polyangiaceae bacterium]|nr:hypothetical protein [Polyangiaceae bacterium]
MLGKTVWRSAFVGVAAIIILTSKPAAALDLSGGVHLGGVLIGTTPRFALSPRLGIAERTDWGFLLAFEEVASILPAFGVGGVGVYNHTSVAIGYAWKNGTFKIGPSLVVYSTPVCGLLQCARLAGISPGLATHVDYYFSDSLGVAASATVDWLTGSVVLPAGIAASVLVGPVLRWRL